MKPLSSSQIDHILFLLDKGHTATQIASTTGYSLSTISRVRSKHRPTISKSTGGRPSKLSPSDTKYAIRLLTSCKADNASQVTKALQNVTNQPVSSKTIQRTLKRAGMKRKWPLLTRVHKQKRLVFAKTYANWTVEDWKQVVWTDETKINQMGSDGRHWVWKTAGEGLSDRLVNGTVKFGGGSCMIWGCMLWQGPGHIHHIEGTMDGDLYVHILDDKLYQSLKKYRKKKWQVLFQQDNDPKHTSKKAKMWLENSGLKVMEWPPQSPDLNPIEQLWTYVKNRLEEYENYPSSITELRERVDIEWGKIPASVCQNLIESMPRRVQAVLQAKGGYTKY